MDLLKLKKRNKEIKKENQIAAVRGMASGRVFHIGRFKNKERKEDEVIHINQLIKSNNEKWAGVIQ